MSRQRKPLFKDSTSHGAGGEEDTSERGELWRRVGTNILDRTRVLCFRSDWLLLKGKIFHSKKMQLVPSIYPSPSKQHKVYFTPPRPTHKPLHLSADPVPGLGRAVCVNPGPGLWGLRGGRVEQLSSACVWEAMNKQRERTTKAGERAEDHTRAQTQTPLTLQSPSSTAKQMPLQPWNVTLADRPHASLVFILFYVKD